MKRVFTFGKIDYNKTGRKACKVTLEVTYKDGAFSASGNIWNPRETDIYMGGQCLDSILEIAPELAKNSRYMEILDFWKKYHLNDMRAGTPAQHAVLDAAGYDRGKDGDWHSWACTKLKEAGLYEIPASDADPYRKHETHKGKPYRFGHEWLFHPIPETDAKRIEALFNIVNGEK